MRCYFYTLHGVNHTHFLLAFPETVFLLFHRWWLWPQCTWPREWDSVLSGVPKDVPEQHCVRVGDQCAAWQEDPFSLCFIGHRRQRLPGQLPPPVQRHRTKQERDWWGWQADVKLDLMFCRGQIHVVVNNKHAVNDTEQGNHACFNIKQQISLW